MLDEPTLERVEIKSTSVFSFCWSQQKYSTSYTSETVTSTSSLKACPCLAAAVFFFFCASCWVFSRLVFSAPDPCVHHSEELLSKGPPVGWDSKQLNSSCGLSSLHPPPKTQTLCCQSFPPYAAMRLSQVKEWLGDISSRFDLGFVANIKRSYFLADKEGNGALNYYCSYSSADASVCVCVFF